MTTQEIKKEFTKIIHNLSYGHNTWDVFRDFVDMSALSIMQSVDWSDDREQRYMDIVKRYEKKEVDEFPKLLGCVIKALEIEYSDFLGDMFMELELYNKWKGQFFTPYHLCVLMSRLTFNIEDYKDGRIVTLNEPTCGGGAMVIAYCETLQINKINFQTQLQVVAQDIDYISCCMTYIQLSLLGCDAAIVHGNTLTCEAKEIMITPIRKLNHLKDPSRPLYPTLTLPLSECKPKNQLEKWV